MSKEDMDWEMAGGEEMEAGGGNPGGKKGGDNLGGSLDVWS